MPNISPLYREASSVALKRRHLSINLFDISVYICINTFFNDFRKHKINMYLSFY